MAFELPTLDFMGHRKTAAVASALLVITTIVALALGGINRGLDFTGGALVEVGFPNPVEPATVRSVLDDAGLTGGVVQNYGSETELLVRMPPVTGVDQSDLGTEVAAVLARAFAGVDLRRSEFVGPAVGEELTEKGRHGALGGARCGDALTSCSASPASSPSGRWWRWRTTC